jgi:hypothetical protein
VKSPSLNLKNDELLNGADKKYHFFACHSKKGPRGSPKVDDRAEEQSKRTNRESISSLGTCFFSFVQLQSVRAPVCTHHNSIPPYLRGIHVGYLPCSAIICLCFVVLIISI